MRDCLDASGLYASRRVRARGETSWRVQTMPSRAASTRDDAPSTRAATDMIDKRVYADRERQTYACQIARISTTNPILHAPHSSVGVVYKDEHAAR